MNERPILFSGQMVHAILDRRKTQTRRVIQPQLPSLSEGQYFDAYNGGPNWNFWLPDNRMDNRIKGPKKDSCQWTCPYGKPGDRLWVRETWGVVNGLDSVKPSDIPIGIPIIYRASSVHPDDPSMMWRSPYFIKRWMSRLTLEITDVRVQRVQEISEGDAQAEGVTREMAVDTFDVSLSENIAKGYDQGTGHKYRNGFHDLWDSINEKRKGCSWSDNPWVWCLSFKRVEGV